MASFLDNPAWGALISGNKNLANGNGRVKYFDKEVSPFAALKENSAGNFKELYDAVPHTAPLIIVTPNEIEIPGPWTELRCIHGIQMICEEEPVTDPSVNLTPLTQAHVPQMLELTKLT